MLVVVNIDLFVIIKHQICHAVPVDVYKLHQGHTVASLGVSRRLVIEEGISLDQAEPKFVVYYFLGVDFEVSLVVGGEGTLSLPRLLQEDVWHAVAVQIHERVGVRCGNHVCRVGVLAPVVLAAADQEVAKGLQGELLTSKIFTYGDHDL